MSRRVALEVLHPDRRRDASAHERLIREARALARLDHPNIVPVHDAVNHDGELVMVMELVTGETLESWQNPTRCSTARCCVCASAGTTSPPPSTCSMASIAWTCRT